MSFFYNVRFLNESQNQITPSLQAVVNEAVIERALSESAVYCESNEYIKDCRCFMSEAMVLECSNNYDLVHQSCLLEGAKFDALMKNFLKEGQDYKGLKKDLKEIIAANNLSEANLRSKGKGFLHVCKRILQVCYDISAVLGPVTGAVGVYQQASAVKGLAAAFGASIPVAPMIVGAIVGFIIGFIINRLIRFAIDYIEFKQVKDDAEDIVKELRRQADSAENESIAKKFRDQAEKLEKSIEEYSKKHDDKED